MKLETVGPIIFSLSLRDSRTTPFPSLMAFMNSAPLAWAPLTQRQRTVVADG